MEENSSEHSQKEETNDNQMLGKKTTRGRPKISPKIIEEKAKANFDSFLKNGYRAKNNDEIFGLPEIEEEINKIIKDILKDKSETIEELAELKKINNENKYFIIKYWNANEKEKKESLDQIFVRYLKEFSVETNKAYFFFMLRLIMFLREFINSKKKSFQEKKKGKSNKSTFFDKIFIGNIVKNLGNDFVILFLKKERGEEKQTLLRYFKMESIKDINNEIKELYIHLCFWLYEYKYAESFLMEYVSDEENNEGNEKPKKNKKTKKDKKKNFNVKKIK